MFFQLKKEREIIESKRRYSDGETETDRERDMGTNRHTHKEFMING